MLNLSQTHTLTHFLQGFMPLGIHPIRRMSRPAFVTKLVVASNNVFTVVQSFTKLLLWLPPNADDLHTRVLCHLVSIRSVDKPSSIRYKVVVASNNVFTVVQSFTKLLLWLPPKRDDLQHSKEFRREEKPLLFTKSTLYS